MFWVFLEEGVFLGYYFIPIDDRDCESTLF